MTMVRINVTQEHIEQGVRGNVYSCAVALAAQEVLGRDIVMIADIALRRGAVWSKFAVLPEMVRAWIVEFDDGRSMAPITFELDIPESW